MLRLTDTKLWQAKIKFESPGEKNLIIKAIDGAGNNTQKSLNRIILEKPGVVTSGKPVPQAKIELKYFDADTNSWVLWDGGSYGQENPKLTAKNGEYGYIVPAGKYYLEVTKYGFHKTQSKIFEVKDMTAINFDLLLSPLPKLEITLPVFGDITLSLPDIFPPSIVPAELSPGVYQKIIPFAVGKKLNVKTIDPASLADKKTLISIISYWSSQSLDQIAILSQAYKALPVNQNLQIIGYALQETPEASSTFEERGLYNFPIISDKDGVISESISVQSLPEHLFIDSEGIIRDIIYGVVDQNTLFEKLSALP